MPLLMQPRELAVLQPAPHQAEIILHLDAALFWFRGHFPDQPVLPGVAQLEWAILYTRRLLADDCQLQCIRQMKFQSPLLPEQRISLLLEWQPSRQLLLFRYQRHEWDDIASTAGRDDDMHEKTPLRRVLTSSGKIQLCQ